jgi:hypothetical protein
VERKREGTYQREREREKVDWLDFYSERRIRDMLYKSDGGRRIEEEEVG